MDCCLVVILYLSKAELEIVILNQQMASFFLHRYLRTERDNWNGLFSLITKERQKTELMGFESGSTH